MNHSEWLDHRNKLTKLNYVKAKFAFSCMKTLLLIIQARDFTCMAKTNVFSLKRIEMQT